MLDKYQSGLHVFFSGGNFDQINSPLFHVFWRKCYANEMKECW